MREGDSITMNIGGVDSFAYDWLRRARIDVNIALSQGLQHASGIERCLLEGSIAMDGRDA